MKRNSRLALKLVLIVNKLFKLKLDMLKDKKVDGKEPDYGQNNQESK